MNKNLIHLSERLRGLGNNAASIKVLAMMADSQVDTQPWQIILEEVQKPDPERIFARSAKYIYRGYVGLSEAMDKLQGLSADDIATGLELGRKIPGAVKGSNINLDVIKKFSSDFNKLNKTAQMGWGTTALRIMPYIGAIFSGIMAVKSIFYGYIEYKNLSSISTEIGLNWFDTLFADKIMPKVLEYKDNPEKLLITTKVAKSARIFVEDAISSVANTIDFAKDTLFAFIEGLVAAGSFFIPPGWAATLGLGGLDISLSVIIMIIEYYATGSAQEKYTVTLDNISKTAQEKIKGLSVIDYDNYEWSKEELSDYMSSLSL